MNPNRKHNRPPQQGLHRGVILLLIALFALILLPYWVAFGGSLQPAFMVGVSTAFLVAYVATPWALLRTSHSLPEAPAKAAYTAAGKDTEISFTEFLKGDMETLTGLQAGWEATVTVLLIPAALALAAIGTCTVLILVRSGVF